MTWPQTYNFNYYTGDLYQFVIYPKEDGEQFNLNGYSSLFVIATERGNPNAIALTLTPQVSASPSRLVCTIQPYQGRFLSGPSYIYDIEITKNNSRYTLLTGRISTQLDVTRS